MAGIGDIVVTAHTDDSDDDDGMVPAPVDGLPTAPLRRTLPELPSPGGMIDQNTESIENSNTPQKQSR